MTQKEKKENMRHIVAVLKKVYPEATCALEWDMMALCVVLSIVGIVLVIFAYPMYNYFLKRNKARYGEEILELSNKLLDIKEE